MKGDQICCSFFDQANEMQVVALNQSDRNCKIIPAYASKHISITATFSLKVKNVVLKNELSINVFTNTMGVQNFVACNK